MRDVSKHLAPCDLEAIKSWIEKVERHKYRPKKLLGKKAHKDLNLTYKMIGYGKKRIAYDIDNGLVLKIAITTSGIKNNMTEVEIYQTVSSKLRRHLAKVKEHGHGWLIMKKLKKEVKRTNRNKSELKRVQRKFESRGVCPDDLITRKKRVRWSNIRLDAKRKIIIIDYGNFKFM